MTGLERRNALLLLTILLVAVFVLAVSFSSLELQPGMPLPELQENEVIVSLPDNGPLEPLSINQFFKIFFGILLACSIAYMLYQLFRGASWRNVLAILRVLVIVTLIMSVVVIVVLMMPVSSSKPEVQVMLPTPKPLETAPLGPVPPVLIWIVGIALLATGITIVVWIYRASAKQGTAIDMVMREAEKARQDLLIGIGLKDVILKCYRAMSMALETERGIERDQSMTTLEFEEKLTAAGIPSGPVCELTHLFNLARYGNWQPDAEDERRAILCFETIAKFSCEKEKAD
ncbi:MAG: DUF4129 domain-containing protein [Leptolinea sp.]|nr:DUF4129 domain-containing protein [Leptolinea sp.]